MATEAYSGRQLIVRGARLAAALYGLDMKPPFTSDAARTAYQSLYVMEMVLQNPDNASPLRDPTRETVTGEIEDPFDTAMMEFTRALDEYINEQKQTK